jgi:hypothetical protein
MPALVRRNPAKRIRIVKIFGKRQAREIMDALDSLFGDPENNPRPISSGNWEGFSRADGFSPQMKPG